MSRPSMYTGLPLMPLMRPVCSNGPPESRTRIMSMRGPKAPFNTPKISTWKVSISVPWKVVSPKPLMPRRNSLGAMVGCARSAGAAKSNDASATSMRNEVCKTVCLPFP